MCQGASFFKLTHYPVFQVLKYASERSIELVLSLGDWMIFNLHSYRHAFLLFASAMSSYSSTAAVHLARPAGIEPATDCLEGSCSIH
jgi:hypothetical protein